jgi:hypothetical protein
VVVLRTVGLPGKWTEVTISKELPALDVEDRALVLVVLPLPETFPGDGTAFFPVGPELGAEHVDSRRFGRDEGGPDLGPRCVNGDGGLRQEILRHGLPADD